MNGFNINAEKKQAEVQDSGTVVELHSVDGQPVFYEDEDGEHQPVTITVAGIHSRQYRAVEHKQRHRKLKPSQLTANAIYEDNLEKVAACVLDWKGIVDEDLKPLPVNTHNIRNLFTSCPWVLDEVMEAMQDAHRFFPSASNEQ